MKKRGSKIIAISIIFLILLVKSVYAVDLEIKEAEYTEEYKRYLELTDEEKEKILEPRKFKSINTDNNDTNENYLKNERVTLNNLLNLLRASEYKESSNFSLKQLIPANLTIRNQMNTNTCWAFTGLSALETNLALKDYVNKTNSDKETGKIYDFSERHMAYAMSQSFKNNEINKYGYSCKVNAGGSTVMATAYLTNGQGAINEKDMPFANNEDDINLADIQNKDIQTTVNNIIYFDTIELKDNALQTESQKLTELKKQMKEHISTYGSISAGVYVSEEVDGQEGEKYENNKTGAIYVSQPVKRKDEAQNKSVIVSANHAVSIIGWDDNYKKENFKTQPQNDGAWIVRNSWGTSQEYTYNELKEIYKEKNNVETVDDESFKSFLESLQQEGATVDNKNQKVTIPCGDNGIYYFSYEDVYIYTNLWGIVDANNKKTYSNIYQLDELGGNNAYQIFSKSGKVADLYLANKFHRETIKTEYLTSIGVTNITSSGTYEVYINPNGTDKTISNLQKAELETGYSITLNMGYNNIKLKNPFKLEGSDFVVVLKQKYGNGEGTIVTLEDTKVDKNVSTNPGESFITVEGETSNDEWMDVSSNNSLNIQGNLCIKAITVDNYSGEVTETPDDKKTVNNSDFSNAKAEIDKISLNLLNKEDLAFEFKFIIRGIRVENLCDNYEHYIYLSSSKNKTGDEIEAQGRWIKLDSNSFEKQEDGTYNLNITINKEEQLLGLEDEDSEEIYIYVKEVATKNGITSTKVYNPLEVIIDPDKLFEEGDGFSYEHEEFPAKEQSAKAPTKTAIESPKSTESPKPLPKTGFKTILIAGLVVLSISFICYVEIRKMKDIK